MENFKPRFTIIDRVFHSRGDFLSKVKEALNLSKNGELEIKSIQFMKAVFGSDFEGMNVDEKSEARKEMNVLISQINKEGENKNSPQKSEFSKYSDNANKTGIDRLGELKRSGGVNPNEL